MKAEKTHLKGVLILTPKLITDDRGFFQESYNQDTFKALGINDIFIQDNHSLSKSQNIIRGLHFQFGDMAQSKLVRVLKGSILDVVVDIDPRSETFMQHLIIKLDDQLGQQIYIPRGYAHGFRNLEAQTHVFYKVDNYYSVAHNTGIFWNDKDLGIEWGCMHPELSDQDKNLPTFKEKMAELERFELSNGFHHYTLSKRAHSTALTQLQRKKQN